MLICCLSCKTDFGRFFGEQKIVETLCCGELNVNWYCQQKNSFKIERNKKVINIK